MKTIIRQWKKYTNTLVRNFINEYFPVGNVTDKDFYWIADIIGETFNYGDYYFHFSDALYCLENNVPIEKLFEWYDWCIEHPHQYMTLGQFLLEPEERKRQEQKYLNELQERVKFAEKELKEALKRYEKL